MTPTRRFFTSAVIIGLKDLRQRMRDQSALVMAFVAPFGLAFILNATLGSATESTVFEFGIVNADAGSVGQNLEATARPIV